MNTPCRLSVVATIFLTSSALLIGVCRGLPAAAGPSPNPTEPDCDPYAYCDGTKFNQTLVLSMRRVRCDQAPNPRNRCCLPQAKHFVCYGITVDGMKLNYDTDPLKTTDFAGLCGALLRLSGKESGKHSSATIENGAQGYLVWRYGDWTETDVGTQYIKNLACEVAVKL